MITGGKFNRDRRPFIFPAGSVGGGGGGGSVNTIYTADDTLTGDRTVSGSGNFLKFVLGGADFEANSGFGSLTIDGVVGNWALSGGGTGVLSSSGKMSLDSSSSNLALQSLAGASRFVGIGNDGSFGTKVDIEVPNGSLNPLSLYENNPGGASIGENFSLDAYFNDSLMARTLGGGLTFRVDTAPTPANVNMSITVNKFLKVQPSGRVFLNKTATTGASNGLFEVRGETGDPGVLLWLRGTNNGTGSIIFGRSLDNTNIFDFRNNGLVVLNSSGLVGGDFIHEGFTDIELIRSDAGLDRVGIGCSVAELDSKFNVDGDMRVVDTSSGYILPDRLGGGDFARVYMQEDAPGVYNLYIEGA